MAKKVTHPDAHRVLEAFKGRTARERNEIFAQHEPAYRVAEMIGAGLVDPAGLTEAGAAGLEKLAEAVGLEEAEEAKSAEKGSTKHESKQ